MKVEAGTRRLFFALWPDAAARRALVEASRHWVRACGGRPMRVENIHLTLAFLGNVTEEVADCVAAAARTVRGEPFELVFDRYGFFPRPRVFWSGPRETPATLVDLVGRLYTALAPCGIEPERRPFKAHLTLARKARPPKGEWRMAPVTWSVDEFVLVESRPSPEGVRYAPIGRYPLGERSALQTPGEVGPAGR